MITKTTFSTTYATAYEELAAFLDDSRYFATVSSENNIIICKDADENTLFDLSYTQGSRVIYRYFISDALNSEINIQNGSLKPTEAYTCNHGIIIRFGDNYHILITKNNNDKIMFVAPSGNINNLSALANQNGIKCLAWGDEKTDSQTYSFISANQTIMRPFGSNNSWGTPSFSPNAFTICVGQNPNIGYGVVSIDGTEFLTNGYWAILDA